MSPDASTEQAFMREIRQMAALYGWLCYHTHDSRLSPPGFPDLFMARPAPAEEGPVYAWECKTATGTLTKEQGLWLTALHGKRIDARVVRPAHFDDLLRLLSRG